MDLVVRRQSEQLNRQNFSESIDDDDNNTDNNRPNDRKYREIYEYRRWEWGNLRVHFRPYVSSHCVLRTFDITEIMAINIICVRVFFQSFFFRRNAKIWDLKHFIEHMYNVYSAVICQCFLYYIQLSVWCILLY